MGIFVTMFLFAMAVTQGALAIGVILRITSARWGASIFRLSLSLGLSFLPVGILMLAAILYSKDSVFTWAHSTADSVWFNYLFFIIRQSLAFVVVYGLALFLFIKSRRTVQIKDEGVPALNNTLLLGSFFTLLSLVIYQTLTSWDIGMLLNHHFADTMYSVLNFTTVLYGGIGLLIITMFFAKKYSGIKVFGDEHFLTSAKIMLALTIVWTFLWWVQYMAIWFVQLPEETIPVYLRIYGYYRPVFLTSLVLLSGIPFISLIFSKVRNSASRVTMVAVSVLGGVFLEKYLVIVPVLEKEHLITKTFILSPVNIITFVGVISGVIVVFLMLVKYNPNILPDKDALVNDPLIAKQQGWQ
ncbi:MAG: hypothetical protein C4562_00375 [Actinobacteria bacterium]|nr:MAG: hypothetical protein C4562_00375 [Actinomycetota bacterium]